MDSAGPNLPLQVTTDGLDLILEGSSDPDNQETLVSGIVFRKDNFLGQEISHSVILSSTGTSSAVKEITMTATLFPSKLVICAQSEVCSGPQQICDCAERPFIEAGLAEYLDDSEKWFLLSIRYSLDTGHLSAALSVLTSEEDIFDLPMEFDPLVTPELYFPYISSSLVAMESSVRMGSLGLVFSSLEPDEPTFPATVLDFKSLVYTMNSDWFLANPSVVCPYWKGIGQNPKCFATTQMPSGTVTTNGVWNAGHYIDKCILSDGLDWPCK
jgi:hypothetical protein